MSNPKKSNKIIKTVSETSPNTDPLSSLRIKLKTTDSEIQNYVTALEAENLKQAKHIAKLQAQNVSLQNRVKVYENERKLHPPIEITEEMREEVRKKLEEIGWINRKKK